VDDDAEAGLERASVEPTAITPEVELEITDVEIASAVPLIAADDAELLPPVVVDTAPYAELTVTEFDVAAEAELTSVFEDDSKRVVVELPEMTTVTVGLMGVDDAGAELTDGSDALADDPDRLVVELPKKALVELPETRVVTGLVCAEDADVKLAGGSDVLLDDPESVLVELPEMTTVIVGLREADDTYVELTGVSVALLGGLERVVVELPETITVIVELVGAEEAAVKLADA